MRHTRALLLLLALLLAGCASELRGGTYEPAQLAPPITTLRDTQGRPFDLGAHRGEVVVLYFGYASCPDVCPAALGELAAARRRLGGDAERVLVAFITVDPQRDTPERLARYVAMFDASFIGLHGDANALAPVLRDYQVTAIRRDLPGSALQYAVDHSAFAYVVDRQGRLRELIADSATVDDLENDLRILARE